MKTVENNAAMFVIAQSDSVATMDFAPKELHKSAQGNALGPGSRAAGSPERAKQPPRVRVCFAPSGLGSVPRIPTPGRCPGLVCLTPSEFKSCNRIRMKSLFRFHQPRIVLSAQAEGLGRGWRERPR